jgi:hypothetical protein
VQLYDYFYKIEYNDVDGNIIRITSPTPFTTITPFDTVNLLVPALYSWTKINNVYTNLSVINSTGTIYAKYVFSDTTNLVRTACLNVQRVTKLNRFDYCNNCTNSTGGTLTCVLDTSLTGEYKIIGLIDTNSTGSWYVTHTTFWGIDSADVFVSPSQGYFFAAIIVAMLAFIGIGSLTGSIVLVTVGIIVCSVIGLATGISLTYIIWLIVLSLIVLIIVRRVPQ